MKLIVLDIDGVLALGEGHPFDLKLLSRLAELNQKAQYDDAIPSVTLNTGRPSPYVEAVVQAISGWRPALFESGAGLYFPQENRSQHTPLMTQADKEALDDMLAILDAELVQSGKAYWQFGKTVCHTLFANAPYTIDDIHAEARDIIAHHSDNFITVSAVIALNIQPKHIDKGTGLKWLAEVTNIDPSLMAGSGDSTADADFLKLIGYPAVPINATDDVKSVAKYISPYADAKGLSDILDYWGV